MKSSSRDPRRERGQSEKSRWSGWAWFRRRWLLKLLLAMAPLATKLVELAIMLMKQPK